MKKINEAKIVFTSHLSNEAFARTAVAAFVATADPIMSELAELKTAVSEAVSNAAVHGYKDKIGYITVKMRLYSDFKVIITVSDKGVGIADIEKAREPLFTTSKSGEQAGMGFTVMESFTDGLKIRSTVGKGTTVTMKKVFTSKDGVK
ncbi:MAG: anti-sigma F factor [Clostridia bacterium]|nr:anti-sigma F factor [Clostridia bacterium]